MTINNMDEFVANLWDWSCLNGCFGNTRISLTDIDGLVERNGKFLVIEAKSPGVKVKTGQRITFTRLVGTGYFTIVVVWGETNKPERIEVMTKAHPDPISYENASIETLRDIVSQWYRFANQTQLLKFTE